MLHDCPIMSCCDYCQKQYQLNYSVIRNILTCLCSATKHLHASLRQLIAWSLLRIVTNSFIGVLHGNYETKTQRRKYHWLKSSDTGYFKKQFFHRQ